MELRIRRATADDAQGMVDILNPIIEARIYSALVSTYTVEAQRAWIEAFPARGILLVAERVSDGRMLGHQSLEPFGPYSWAFDHVGVMGTYVDLHHLRQGVGSRLFAAMYEEAVAAGYEKIFTFVRADNQVGLGAYLAQGFTVAGHAKGQAKIDGRYVDEVMIEKWLVPAKSG